MTYPVCNVPPSDCPTLPSQCAYTNNKIIVARSYVCEIVDSDVSPVAPNTAAQSRRMTFRRATWTVMAQGWHPWRLEFRPLRRDYTGGAQGISGQLQSIRL